MERGYRLTSDDLIRRHVIRRLMCDFAVDILDVESRFEIEFEEYFSEEQQMLLEFRDEGFLEIGAGRISLTPEGSVFVRNICMAFDRHLREKRSERPVFSRTV